jgi:hypothetical protein
LLAGPQALGKGGAWGQAPAGVKGAPAMSRNR